MAYTQNDKMNACSIVSIGFALFGLSLFVSLPFGQAQQIPPPDELHASHAIGICGTKHFEPRLEFCDTRDNQIYPYVKIGKQTWMAENLNYGKMITGNEDQTSPGEKYCLFDKKEKCAALYQWAEAMGVDTSFNAKIANLKSRVQGVCPSGWHIPSSTEWDTLLSFVDKEQGMENEAVSLMSYSENDDFKWKTNTAPDNMMPKNLYGFSVVSTGQRLLKGTCPVGKPNEDYFCNAHDTAMFWTTDEDKDDPVTGVNVNFTEDIPQAGISSKRIMPDISKMTDAQKDEMKKMEEGMKNRRVEQSELQRTYKESQKYQGMSMRCVRD